VLALGPPCGFHAVADDGSEGADREVLVAFESEDRGAVGRIADDGEGDDRHRVTVMQRTRQTDLESKLQSNNRANIWTVVQNDLLTTGQLGQELGLSRQWVDRIIRDAEKLSEAERFPAPLVVLPNGTRLFKRNPALRWFADHPRRPYGQRSASGDPTSSKDVKPIKQWRA
jgi:hypothetical protein